jgi:hypothetical protein
MDDLPRQKLRAIVSAHGRAVCKDPEVVGALLAKVCPDHPREVQALYHALDSFLADKALDDLGERPWKSVAEPVIDELVADHSMTQEEADWAATSWGVALGEISTDQIDSSAALSNWEGQGANVSGHTPNVAGQEDRFPREPIFSGKPAENWQPGRQDLETSHRPSPPSSMRTLGILAAVAIGGLVLSTVLLPGLGGLRRGKLFLNQPASYWSQKLQEPSERKEVWQGRQKIMKDVDPAGDLRRGQPESVPVLIELLEENYPSGVRQEAAAILAKIGGPAKPAIPALQKAAKDPDNDVRSTAFNALRKIDPASFGE